MLRCVLTEFSSSRFMIRDSTFLFSTSNWIIHSLRCTASTSFSLLFESNSCIKLYIADVASLSGFSERLPYVSKSILMRYAASATSLLKCFNADLIIPAIPLNIIPRLLLAASISLVIALLMIFLYASSSHK